MSGPGTGESEATRAANEVAERAAVAARESAAWLRDESARLVANYKKQSKYFKWRSQIIAAYAAVAVVSIVLALPPMNGINAHARKTQDFDGRPLVYLENQSKEEWTDVHVIVNDLWYFDAGRLPAGGSVTVKSDNLRKSGATGPDARPKGDIDPQSVKVKCDQGSYQESFK